MAMTLSATNFFQFISFISPFLLAFTFILIGFMNYEPLKTLIYLGSVSLTMFMVVGLLKFNVNTRLSKAQIMNPSALCGVWNFLDDSYFRPSMSTYFITFTLFYTFIPMFISSQFNYFLFSFILLVLASDSVSKFMNQCIHMKGWVIALVTGALFGSLISFGIHHLDPNLLFFGDFNSNNTRCSKPSNKKFVCSVYKNGQLIKNL
jgi:hypothetical protein